MNVLFLEISYSEHLTEFYICKCAIFLEQSESELVTEILKEIYGVPM